MRTLLADDAELSTVGSVTGPGRSGAVAAVYASHILFVPFIPYKQPAQIQRGRLLIVDTARETGSTLRKAARWYKSADPLVRVVYEEPPHVAFWYEAPKPQRYRHQKRKIPVKSPMITAALYIKPEDKGDYSDLKVMHSAAGWYIGTIHTERDAEGNVLYEEPGSRDSEYFGTEEAAAGYLRILEAGITIPLRTTP